MIPITMVGKLDHCMLLSYSTPEASVQGLLPKPLELITYKGRAFWNIVLCHVDKMRPKRMPRFLGSSYLHVAYRLQARARLADGKAIEGLYFVRSDVDDPLMALGGNIQTDFKFHTARMNAQWGPELHFEIERTRGSQAEASLHAEVMAKMELSRNSLYASLEEREARLKYQPYGLSVTNDGRRLRVAEVKRNEANWHEQGLNVRQAQWRFLSELGQNDLHLERATQVDAIDYVWKLGRTEKLA